jgi:hypothetical protein
MNTQKHRGPQGIPESCRRTVSALRTHRGVPLPATWKPDEQLCHNVKRHFGITDDEIRTELIVFHSYHAAAGSFSANWRASFVTWTKGSRV